MASLLIRGGRIIDPAGKLDATGDVLVVDGRIAAIETGSTSHPVSGDVIEAEGCIVCPGLLDIHVHFRDPHQGQAPRGDHRVGLGGSGRWRIHHRRLHAKHHPGPRCAALDPVRQ